MPVFQYLALSDPALGREDEFNTWYETVHIPQILDVPGFVSAQRFEAVEIGDGPIKRRRYMALYRIEAEDAAQAIAALRARRGTDRLTPSDALDTSSMFAQAYVAITGPIPAATPADHFQRSPG
jgi:hypothetical protein